MSLCRKQHGGLSVEYRPSLTARANIPGELRRLLQSLSPHLDDVTKRTTLHTITQCILLKESEANACSYEDLKLVSTFLDDGDKAIKTEALNALKAFTNIWRFKIKIQEYVPKIIELVTTNSDHNLHVAGLRLLNSLNIPDQTHPVLRGVLQNFMDILLMSNTLAKVQLLRLLSTLAQKEDLLYDIMNCRTRPEFLSLFQPSLPGNLLFEMLFFVERLSEGRLTPQYQSMHRQYSDQSLHEVIFGENSRLSDRLLSLIIHPEEEVQIQACKVILSLRLNKEESKVVSGLPVGANVKVQPQEPTRSSQLTNSTLSNHRFRTSTLSSGAISSNQSHHRSCPQDENGRSFYTLQGIDETGYSFYPLQASAHRSFHPIETSSIQSFPVDECGRVIDDPMDSFHPINASYSDDSDDGTDL
ncbi:armadillo repeat-containing protein 12-like isoform X2 [Hemicordylus capensis]|uniref:armadillo repeat-containing protein 12-like isoform X2 n=1 Tax=Hemicordylus capensis TaxID=884348 RepID=UPI0023049E34|nr:armadillo repeat-containing protein 12-like isoform X2 [Hemicordylus capensis]